ncbi:MAG: DinB family protein [Acidobacteria bacterium]|nr:DinB family protein [Acidobacteriota bacterium]
MRLAVLTVVALAVAPLHAQGLLTTTNIQRYYMPVRIFLQGAAEAMPADKYTFKLAPEQMTFGQWVNHSTERNYVDCATLRGEPNPMPKAKTDLLTGKAEIVKALSDSFAYCDAAFEGIDDQKILATPQMVYAFLHTTVHNNEIYGNIVGYLRANGITPPSTEMIQEMIKAKKTPEQMFKEMMEKYGRKPGPR